MGSTPTAPTGVSAIDAGVSLGMSASSIPAQDRSRPPGSGGGLSRTCPAGTPRRPTVQLNFAKCLPQDSAPRTCWVMPARRRTRPDHRRVRRLPHLTDERPPSRAEAAQSGQDVRVEFRACRDAMRKRPAGCEQAASNLSSGPRASMSGDLQSSRGAVHGLPAMLMS